MRRQSNSLEPILKFAERGVQFFCVVLESCERYQKNLDSVGEASRKLFDQWKPASYQKQ